MPSPRRANSTLGFKSTVTSDFSDCAVRRAPEHLCVSHACRVGGLIEPQTPPHPGSLSGRTPESSKGLAHQDDMLQSPLLSPNAAAAPNTGTARKHVSRRCCLKRQELHRRRKRCVTAEAAPVNTSTEAGGRSVHLTVSPMGENKQLFNSDG